MRRNAQSNKLRAFLDMAALCPSGSSTQHHLDMDAMRSAARPQIAQADQRRPTRHRARREHQSRLNLVANAFPLQPGDRVVICDLEFMEVAVPWVQKRQEIGIEIDTVPNRDGRILIDDIEAAITPKTRVVAISSVQWSNGFRCDLDALSRLCRERGVFLILDAVQQIGAIPLDVQRDSRRRDRLRRTQVADGAVRLRLPLLEQGISREGEAATGRISVGRRSRGRMGHVFRNALDRRPCASLNSFTMRGAGRPAARRIIPAQSGWRNRSDSSTTSASRMSAGMCSRSPTTSSTQLHQHKIRVVTPEAREERSGIVTFTLDKLATTSRL